MSCGISHAITGNRTITVDVNHQRFA
ncbi:MAG: hypothetical protein HOC92_19055 [Gammaproteobacteria bacterium]|nr:hypothetical protein [Gammaproteobacteria bacterium]